MCLTYWFLITRFFLRRLQSATSLQRSMEGSMRWWESSGHVACTLFLRTCCCALRRSDEKQLKCMCQTCLMNAAKWCEMIGILMRPFEIWPFSHTRTQHAVFALFRAFRLAFHYAIDFRAGQRIPSWHCRRLDGANGDSLWWWYFVGLENIFWLVQDSFDYLHHTILFLNWSFLNWTFGRFEFAVLCTWFQLNVFILVQMDTSFAESNNSTVFEF